MFHGLVSLQIFTSESGLGESFLGSVVNFRGSAGPGLNNHGRVDFSGYVFVLEFFRIIKITGGDRRDHKVQIERN